MANLKSVTAADVLIFLTIPGLVMAKRIEGFAPDSIISVDPIATVESSMGVDGHLSFGVVKHPTKTKFTLSPDSDDVAIMDAWRETQDFSLQVLPADMLMVVPATGKSYTFIRGGLTNSKQAPDVKKTLQPQEYEITWESVTVVGVL